MYIVISSALFQSPAPGQLEHRRILKTKNVVVLLVGSYTAIHGVPMLLSCTKLYHSVHVPVCPQTSSFPSCQWALHCNALACHITCIASFILQYCSMVVFSMWCQYIDLKTIPLKVKELLIRHLFELYIRNYSGQGSQTISMSPNKPMSRNNQFIDLRGMESGTVQVSKFTCSQELVQPGCQRHIYRYGYTALP